MRTRKKYLLIIFTVLSLNILIDRITKIGASVFLKGEGVKTTLGGLMKLGYTENTGAFLSLGAGWPVFIKYLVLIVLPAGFCLYGIYYCLYKSADRKSAVILSTIIGGGLGNIIDRIFYDFHVIDFLNFGIGNLRTGILNVADLSVTFGALALVITEYSRAGKPDGTVEK